MEPLEDRRLLSVSPTPDLVGAAGEYDFGDAPDNYGTTLAADAAYHEAVGPTLGSTRDAESDGLPTIAADGDDVDGTDDEDGVTFGTIQVGQLDATVTVNVQNVTTTAYLDAWVDFDGDGCFGGSGELIANSVAVTEGDNVIEFDVPSNAVSGEVYARFRLSTDGDLGSTGAAADGEVEDYQVTVASPELASGDFVLAEAITGGTEGVRAVYSADVDSDGDVDVLVASGDDNRITWFENDGEGEFLSHTITTSAEGASDVFAADVDGDGDIDILSASSDDNTIAWYENHGNEVFTAHAITTSAAGAISVAAADLDSDGDMDVLSGSSSDNTIAWYENDGNGGFVSHVVTSSASGLASVFTVDMDDDSDIDILSASQTTGALVCYSNNGNGVFAATLIATVADGVQSVSAADIDNDGDVDVLCAPNNKTLEWYENQGGNTFAVHDIAASALASAVVAADVDGDGNVDVVATLGDSIAWYENDGAGTFTSQQVYYGSSANICCVHSADIDGDGDVDIVSGDIDAGVVNWQENDGEESFTSRTVSSSIERAWSAVAIDVDGDGDMDVVSASNGQVAWHENDGNQRFAVHVINTTSPFAYSVSATDWDGDGDIDVLVAYATSDAVVWYENDGSEDFDGHTIATSVDGVESATAADMDGDGDMDILLASCRDDQVAWCENDGSESFTLRVIGASSDDVSALYREAIPVIAVDIEGDGDLDVVRACTVGRDLILYENDGNGSFTAQTIGYPGGTPISVAAADLDAEGDIDLLCASQLLGDLATISWYENDGNGSYSQHTISSVASASIGTADVDGDGDWDVLLAPTTDSQIVWCENDGTGQFLVHTTSSSTTHSPVVAADIDGDGDLDVLSNVANSGTITWYENIVSMDYGDAPYSYGTTSGANGASHFITGPTLGVSRDSNTNGLPSSFADGDDTDGSDDEDGVTFVSQLIAGRTGREITVNVQNASSGAKLDVWIDFNGDSVFSSDEQIADSIDVVDGDNTITFDMPESALAGMSYARFRLSTAGDLDPTGAADDGEVEDYQVTIYSENLDLTPEDLGAVDFVERSGVDLSESAKAYAFTTTRAGYLTIDSQLDSSAGEATIRLIDSDSNIVAEVTTADGYARIDQLALASGESYVLQASGANGDVTLRICNLVEVNDTAVTVHGTAADDAFTYASGQTHALSINGIDYEFALDAIATVDFDGGEGTDSATLTGSAGDETAAFYPGHGAMTTTDSGVVVTVADTEDITLNSGGGNDEVELEDSDGDDTLVATTTQMTLTGTPTEGSPYSLTANNFRYAHAYARNGGDDTATLEGSEDYDRIKAYPDFVRLFNSTFYNRVKFFDAVAADTLGGDDYGVMLASDNADVVWAMKNDIRIAQNVELAADETPDYDALAYNVTIAGCEFFTARADGDDDWIELHDSAGKDVLIAKPHKIMMMNGPSGSVARGEEYTITARGFYHMASVADQGGDYDAAKLYDSSEDGTDVWAAAYSDGETWSTMTSPSRLLYEVAAFEQVGGYGFNGGLGEDHGTNTKDHAEDVDFVFEYGYWE